MFAPQANEGTERQRKLCSRFEGSIPTEGDGFLRVIKIRSTNSFGGEVFWAITRRRLVIITTRRRVIAQKTTDYINIAAEA
jgi:hypothetical protein